MDTLKRFYILVIFSVVSEQAFTRRTYVDPFPLGTIGCLVADVCDQGDICKNDLLFGRCRNMFSRDLASDKLNLLTSQIEHLDSEIRRLITAGFTWRDAYTQCVLQNTLVDFAQSGTTFDRSLCEDALGVLNPAWSNEVKDEIASVLVQLLDSGKEEQDVNMVPMDAYGRNYGIGRFENFNSDKRDEIVKVHKYFDASKGQLKRDSYRDDGRDLVLNDLFVDSNRQPSSYEHLRSFLQRKPSVIEDEIRRENSDYNPFDTPSSADEGMGPSYFSNKRLLQKMYRENMKDNVEEQETPKVTDSTDSDNWLYISKEDEALLEALLAGDVSPDNLDQDQKRRMEFIVQTLIRVIDPEINNVSDEIAQETAEKKDDVFVGESRLVESRPNIPVDESGMGQSFSQEDNDSDVNHEGPLDNERMANLPLAGLDNQDNEKFDKEKLAPEPAHAVFENTMKSTPKTVDTNSFYLVLSKEIETPDAMQFIENLSTIMKLPNETFRFMKVDKKSKMIKVKIREDRNGEWTSQKIAEEATNHNNELEKRTGYKVTQTGVGWDTKVAVKTSDRPYFIVTFVLVGTIAGVVLAVVTIYLIKRHQRSRQKLAQIATPADGNEASKDYQDLCRQRMQGKSSEKPEPLHAAGRIGSVSEAQVRSPSSRSSTSSWSEEPAATNMDISTGHIVLSYMEDHLKNQDRLDKEWEAVSSYVADPACTTVATDTGNARKNRFTDILPYDHSRVVLSSNANIGNSDYTNASFITDHDPRNPAYICTQGPLPHTIADFWQMIWEQGSVVIVMLTKLTENGSSLCHRYWPEEGSDLYHIYEVHLVSEHIWCDDYLVRSFYLKNLQTNETRTVTQFHFLTWPHLSVPASIKALLDFRRKVNKSFRGRSCPIVVHCSDGCGRSGTYCLIDMVLNKMAKGAKEIDMAATLEHIRDQRMSLVETKEQFQFSLAAVAEEVHAILKALPQ